MAEWNIKRNRGAGKETSLFLYIGIYYFCLEEMFGKEGRDIPALYGGSVNPDNSDALIIQPDIDGLFTTRTAFQVDTFTKLIKDAVTACKESGKF